MTATRHSLAALALVWTFPAAADELHLRGGDVLTGTLQRVEGEKAFFETSYAGEIEVAREAVIGIVTDAPVTVVLGEGRYLSGRLRDAPGPGFALEPVRIETTRTFTLDEVQSIYREDLRTVQRRELRVKLSGRLNVGLNVTQGNNETERIHFDGRVRARTPQNRYTVSGEHTREKTDGEKIQDETTALIKYDHFFNEKWFWFNSVTFNRDRFRDLNLRTAVASGFGYQFFEEERHFLSVEAGASYINEDFDVGDDQGSAGMRWAIDLEQGLLFDWLTFFHFHEGLQSLDETEDLVVRSRTGFNFDLTESFIATTQANIDWDNTPPPGRVDLDEEYLLTIGYRF